MGGMFKSFASGGFLALLFTIGTVFIVVSINSAEINRQKEKILKEAKEIYSLDYSSLKNIKGIEMNIDHEYFVVLKKDNSDFELRLANNNVPHTQSEIEALDKKFEDVSIRINKEGK